MSTNDAYLEPAPAGANLTIEGGALVDRVELDGRPAVGVVTADGIAFEADEIIVVAGAIHSPAILLRSGIGPAIGLPVGDNLIDHPVTPIVLTLSAAGQPRSVNAPMASSVLRYTSERVDAGDNDMQLVWMSPFASSDNGLSMGFMFPAVMHVFSRGTVRLRSNDPNDDPAVDLQMLSDERDLVRLRDGFRLAERVLNHPGVVSIATITGTAADVDATDDGHLDIWLKTNINDYKHPVGTCRMGRPTTPPRSSTPPAGSAVSRGCASAMRRSCLTFHEPTPTSRPSPSPNASRANSAADTATSTRVVSERGFEDTVGVPRTVIFRVRIARSDVWRYAGAFSVSGFRPVLLVHGAWHGAWCWSGVQAALDGLGVSSWAIDLPGHGLSNESLGDLVTDAECVRHRVGGDRSRDRRRSRAGRSQLRRWRDHRGTARQVAAGGNIAHLVYLTAARSPTASRSAGWSRRSTATRPGCRSCVSPWAMATGVGPRRLALEVFYTAAVQPPQPTPHGHAWTARRSRA